MRGAVSCDSSSACNTSSFWEGLFRVAVENAALEKSEYLQYCVRFDESYTRKKWLMSVMEFLSRSANMPHSPGHPGI